MRLDARSRPLAGRLEARSLSAPLRWLVIGRPDALGRHYEAEASTRREAERLAAAWSGVIVDRRPRPRWSWGERSP